MTRNTFKNRINNILRENTCGSFTDSFWEPVNRVFRLLEEEYSVTFTGSKYSKDQDGNPCSKTWTFEIAFGDKKPFYGILTCHGAGSVEEPLNRYDISAYVS